MYIDKDNNVVNALNSYVWKLLQVNLGWTKTDFQGSNPIIPAAQMPEFNDNGHDYIVYSSTANPSGPLWAIKSETVAYTIYSNSTTSADAVVNMLHSALERMDESAADINNWIDQERAHNGETSQNLTRAVSFMSVWATVAEKAGNPSDEQGGQVASTILLNVLYTEHNNVVTRFQYP